MSAPNLPVELLCDILQILVNECEFWYEPTTKLLTLAAVSKTWKPVVEELALRHVEVEIGNLELARDGMAARRAKMREQANANYVPNAWHINPLPSDEDLKVSQRYTEGVIASASVPAYTCSLDINLHMRDEKEVCATALHTLAALCARFSTAGDALDLEESQPAPSRKLQSVYVRLYQEKSLVEERHFRRALQSLAHLGSLRFLGLQIINEGEVLAVDGEGAVASITTNAGQASRQIRATEVDLFYSSGFFGRSLNPGDGPFWAAIDPSVLKELSFGATTRLPPFDWFSRCQILQELHIEYSMHEDVASTAAALFDLLPRLRQLHHLTLGRCEITINRLQNSLVLAGGPMGVLHRYPSPYSLTTFLNSLSSSVVSANLHHTHFELPADFSSVPVSEELELAIRTRPHGCLPFVRCSGRSEAAIPECMPRLARRCGRSGVVDARGRIGALPKRSQSAGLEIDFPFVRSSRHLVRYVS